MRTSGAVRAAGLPPWQLPAARLERADWDALVVGGGPAGATAALHLARSGCRVLLVERAAYPRDKACGDLLIPDAQAALARAGLLDRVRARAHAVEEAVVSSPSRIEWTIPGRYLVLERRRLDTLLAEAAAGAGAVVAKGHVTAVESAERGPAVVRVRERDGALCARFVVLAAGSDVSLLERLGGVERAAPTAFALRAYVRSSVRGLPLFISFDRGIVPGYAWAFPLPEGWFNVGVGVLCDERGVPAGADLRRLLDAFCRDVPPARRIVEHADEIGPVRGARLRCGLAGARVGVGAGNVLAAGEQIGTTYPFTGEGIGKAMETGEMAAEAVAGVLGGSTCDPLEEYGARIDRLRLRYRGYEVAQRWLARPWLNDLVSRRMRRGGFLRDAAAGMVAEKVDPARVFSWRGMLLSLLR